MVSALIAFANGSEDMEATSVASILDRGGVKVTRAAITADGSREVTLSHGMKIVCDKHISECNDVYDMIVIPGGLDGSKNCADCVPLITMLKEQKAAGRYIGAICAAPGFVLAKHDLVGEARATGYPGCCDSIKHYTNTNTCIDKEYKLVTGKGPALSIEFGLACLEALVPFDVVEQVKTGMLFKDE